MDLELEAVMSDPAVGVAPLHILVVDDEASIRKTLWICLEEAGHQVVAVGRWQDALDEIGRRVFDMAFLDLRLGDRSGLDLMPLLLEAAPWLKIVVITAFASVETAVDAMRRGATDYIAKPFSPMQVRVIASKVAGLRALERRVERLEEDLQRLSPETKLDSADPAMRRVIDLARQVAATDSSVLLCGETGTGKTLVARAIHAWSRRSARSLAVISCPSLSPELLESELFGHVKGAFTGAVRDAPGRIATCEGGTLVLDEVGDLPPAIQPKLLRFLQDREYERLGDPTTRRADVRVIAATNADLKQAMAEGRFREDLYFRLNVVELDVPPLRKRPDDVELLANRLLQILARENHRQFQGFTEEAVAVLRGYRWPGNIRELRNIIERATIFCREPRIGLGDLPETLVARDAVPQLGDLVDLSTIERLHLRRVMAATPSLQEAAEVLGIDPATLWRKRKEYDL